MRPRARAIALRQQRPLPGPAWWAVLATLALATSLAAANAQNSTPGGETAPGTPPAAQPTTPAEIQPGHSAGGKPTIVAPSTGASGPQTAVPAPLPPGAGADTPGGSARKGVIAPPPTASDQGINRGAPSTGTFPMPVIRPPGAPGGNEQVVPK